MRKTAKLLALAMCAALVLCLFAACGQENEPNVPSDVDADVDTNEETFEFTVAARPAEGDLVTTTMSWFAEEIEARSDGRIKLDLQYNGVLCSQGTEFEALESGICDIAIASLSSNSSRWPSLGWVTVPGMVDTYLEQRACLDAIEDAGYLDAELEQNNVKLLWWQPAECFNFALTDVKVESLDDFAGLKIGYAGGADIANVLSAIGAAPVGTNAADFYMNLSTGVLDGFVNPAQYMYDAQFYEVVSYMPVGITCGGSNNSVYMNMDKFNSMPEDLQATFTELCEEAEEHFMDSAAALYENEYDRLTENGCECYELSQDVIDEYNAICADLSSNWVNAQVEAGNENAEAIVELIEETKASVQG